MEAPPETLAERDGVLPMLLRGVRPRPVLSVLSCSYTKEGCNEDGDGKKEAKEPKKKKDGFASFVEELAFAAAILNGRMNEETKRPDGKEYGIIGGTNEDGPNHPLLICSSTNASPMSSSASARPASLSRAFTRASKTNDKSS